MTDKNKQDEYFMRQALALAEQASHHGEVPVGAIVEHNQTIIASGWNQPIASHDPTAHAEIVALRVAAQALQNYRLTGATLYVTLEPCMMCMGAMIHARIARLVFGAFDNKAVDAALVSPRFVPAAANHVITCEGGVLEEACKAMLVAFFKARRDA